MEESRQIIKLVILNNLFLNNEVVCRELIKYARGKNKWSVKFQLKRKII